MIDEKAFLERLDRIIVLLEEVAKPPSLPDRIAGGVATGIGILGIITIIDVIKSWIGG
jgi:hypothetical protein